MPRAPHHLWGLPLVLLLPSIAWSCTLIAIGKDASVDGHAMLAHTDDAGGDATDIRMVHISAQDHRHGARRPVYEILAGYPRVVTEERGAHYAPKGGQRVSKPMGSIPQVPHTYSYFDHNYALVNEVGLCVAESTAGAKTAGWSKNVPYGHNLFGIGELSKVALERCATARCAIQTMGDLAVEYGFFTPFTGTQWQPAFDDSAEVLGVADRAGEVWVFHVMTGAQNRSAIWAAQRVPDDQILAAPNTFVIRHLNLSDKSNFMASKNVFDVAKENGWWKPADGPLDFAAVYGIINDPAPSIPLYDGRRMWRVYDLVAPSLKLDPRWGYMLLPGRPTYPFSVVPDRKLHVRDVFAILRDFYEGTAFDLTKGLAAGPFGSPVRYDGDNGLSGRRGNNGAWERPISIFRAIYSFVMEIRPHAPAGIETTMWFGLEAPHGTVYVPFFCGQQGVPEAYLLGTQSKVHQRSAWWAFNIVNNWANLMFSDNPPAHHTHQTRLEDLGFALQEQVDRVARRAKHSREVMEYVDKHQPEHANLVVDERWEFVWHLISKYNNGYITTGEAPGQMYIPGYPVWWLKAVGYDKWPGATFIPPTTTERSGAIVSAKKKKDNDEEDDQEERGERKDTVKAGGGDDADGSESDVDPVVGARNLVVVFGCTIGIFLMVMYSMRPRELRYLPLH